MSREIKFRAWHEQDKEMVYFKNDKLVNDQYQMQHLANLINGDYGDVLMQYTGLKDKSAIEIYEGDIVNHNGIGVGYISYNDKHAAYKIVFKGTTRKWLIDMLEREIREVEVIGNIYENPELLEANK